MYENKRISSPQGSIFPKDDMSLGQFEFYSDALETVRTGKILLANAPTGIGKTAAALSILQESIPAGRKVIFLTTRDTHHIQAIQEIREMNEKRADALAALGIKKIKAIDKVGKGKMCLLKAKGVSKVVNCDVISMSCDYRRQNFPASDLLLSDPIDAETAVKLSIAKDYCAHYAALIASKDADVIVCDYSYLFDREIRKIFFQYLDVGLGNCDIIIDEAHNLADRILDLNTYQVDSEVIKESLAALSDLREICKEDKVLDSIESVASYIKTSLRPYVKILTRKSSYLGGEIELSSSEVKALLSWKEASVTDSLLRISEYVQFLFSQKENRPEQKISVDDLMQLSGVLCSAEAFLSGDKTIGLFFDSEDYKNFRLRAVPFDPAIIAKGVIHSAHSAILMSGTLPMKDLLIKQLGLDEKRVLKLDKETYPSPFDPLLQPVVICAGASSMKKDRNDKDNIDSFKKVIRDTASAVYPNSMAVYYPSYKFMELLKNEEEFPDFKHEVEIQGESNKHRKERKDRIEKYAKENVPFILHGIMGGSYYEGIDFRFNPFKAIVVAGFPISTYNASQKAYQRYLRDKFDYETAWKMSAIMPAMIRTNQAIGRGIRNERDWCASILVDSRFMMEKVYLQPHLRSNIQYVSVGGMGEFVSKFIKKMNGSNSDVKR